MLYITNTVPSDLKRVGWNLRKADRDEITAWGYRDPLIAVKSSASFSNCYTIRLDGIPVGIFGITNTGQVWMVGTNLLTIHSAEFLRGCLDLIPLLSMKHERWWNKVHATNRLHIRWLRWLGFEIGPSLIPGFLEFSAPCASLNHSLSQRQSPERHQPSPATPLSGSQPPLSPSSRTNSTQRSAEPPLSPTDAT